MVMAFGKKKLFLNLLVLVFMHLYRLPEGNRLNRSKPGWELSLMTFSLC